MTTVRVSPGIASGTVRAPPSKSYTHRALVAGHLSGRRFAVEEPLDADDTRRTALAISALGSRVQYAPHRWTVLRPRPRPRRPVTIDCGESGTTLRFVAALAARDDLPVRLRAHGRLPQRPIADLRSALRSLGATWTGPTGATALPATVRGPLHGGRIRLNASLSSQFVSSLLLTLPTVPGDSTLDLRGPVVSAPYIEATLAVLREQRVRVDRRGRHFAIPGDQRYRGRAMRVPGDASSAAYLWTAAAVTGGQVHVTGIPRQWPQADLAMLGVLRAAGASVRQDDRGATVEGRAHRGFDVDLTGSPDLYPLAGVLAATIPGSSRLRGAAHIVHKESDRREGTRLLAEALGAEVHRDRGGLNIRGTAQPRRFRLRSLDDHRLVMSAGVGALAADSPSTIGDARAVTKSFPGFWSVLASLVPESRR